MTEPAPGLTPAFVDWYRLYWALPSPMHEGLRVRALCPTGYKVMRCSPHASSAQSRIKTSCRWLRDFLRPDASALAPCSLPSRRGLFRPELAASAERRPALTAAARGASEIPAGRDEETASGRTKKLAEGKHCHAAVIGPTARCMRHNELAAQSTFLLTIPIQGAGFKPARRAHAPVQELSSSAAKSNLVWPNSDHADTP